MNAIGTRRNARPHLFAIDNGTDAEVHVSTVALNNRYYAPYIFR
ncbi:hypothetical protein RSAG8_06342, partial [Rhizoctonia solani AG-8 WAC10335]